MSRRIQKQASKAPQTLCHATIVEILAEGEILVDLGGDAPQRVLCDFLETATPNNLRLEPGDRVMVSPPQSLQEKGCVLGKVGGYQPPETKRVEICADEELTIRCGEGSITIRKDGKVLIKGLDVVSHAKRSNRVRGGSIQLN